MKRFKEIITTKKINIDTAEEETTTKENLYCIKTWEELTRQQKEKAIEENQENIYNDYQEVLYQGWLCDIDNLQYEIKNITFDNIYLDSNSQGGWIDSVKNFQLHFEGIEIFGEYVEVDDVDLHFCKYIENIKENDLYIYDYYINDDKMAKIKNTKKYKKWVKNIIDTINKWIDLVNEYAKIMIENEYHSPYNLDNEDDADFLNNFFSDYTFNYELVKNENGEYIEA